MEVCSVESLLQDKLVNVLALATEIGWNVVGNRCFRPVASGNLVGNVGAGQDTTVDAQSVGDGLRQQLASVGVHLQALQARDGSDLWRHLANQLFADSGEELVGDVEDQKIGTFNSLFDVWVGHQVFWQLDVGHVSDVLVVGVDDIRQLSAANVFLENPHVDLLFKDFGFFSTVFGHKLGHGSTPVTGADNGDSEWLRNVIRRRSSHVG